MAENSAPKKRGRKKGSVSIKKTNSKRIYKDIENLSFEQLQELNVTITNLVKTKKDEQIRVLRSKLAELEKM